MTENFILDIWPETAQKVNCLFSRNTDNPERVN